MSTKSPNWLRHTALNYLYTLLGELVTDEAVIQKDDAITTSEVHPDEIIIQQDSAISISEVHPDTDIIDLAIDVPDWARIRFKTTAADPPAPLVVDTVYFAIRTSENHIKVATTKANAKAGIAIDITDTGSGTHTLEEIEKKVDKVETTPTNTEWKDSDRVIFIYPGADEHSFSGIPGDDVELSASIFIKGWGSSTAAEGIIMSLETLLAEIRDKIREGIVSETGFRSLDPPVQVEGCSISDDPGYSMERDLSTATLELRIKNHGS